MRATTSVSAVEALLLELIAEVRGLRADMRQPKARPVSLSRADRALLGHLLPAVAGALGSELFCTSELFESSHAALRVARRGLNPKQVGRLLRRAVGIPVDGLVVERVASEAGAVVWRISELLGDQKPFRSSRALGALETMGAEVFD